MGEVRNAMEGTLSWVQASGSGLTWVTASAPTSAVNMAFVRNFSWTSAQTIRTVENRGVPNHNKKVSVQPVQISCTLAWANTAQFPNPITGAGATVKMCHLEFKMTGTEAGVGYYHQFHGVPVEQIVFTEGAEENTLAFTCRALAMVGPTGSGYLS